MSSIGTLLADASYHHDLVVSRIIIQIVFQHFQEARVGPRFCKSIDLHAFRKNAILTSLMVCK